MKYEFASKEGHPEQLWQFFSDFNEIPRPSKNEAKIQEYIINFAKDRNLEFKQDSTGNIVIYHPGTISGDPLIIQNHLDMVTDSEVGKNYNPMTDPIETYVDGDWVKAKGTTLGADNGIGCCAALAVLDQANKLKIPPLEVLFTIDEETGLVGANGLDSSMFKGKRMLNLDTEEWGSIYIGCAGGKDYELTGNLIKDSDITSLKTFNLSIENLAGGHSGVDIHRNRLNGISELARFLSHENYHFHILDINGGRAHNIIPRSAKIQIACSEDEYQKIKSNIDSWLSSRAVEINQEDHDFKIQIENFEITESKGLNLETSQKLIKWLAAFPHGVHQYLEGLEFCEEKIVDASNNLARVIFTKDQLYVQTSFRFFNQDKMEIFEKKLNKCAQELNLQIKSDKGYPSWVPQKSGNLLDKASEVYQQVFNEKPEVKAIHAGLECGILLDKIPNAQAISFGPTIINAHSPQESVHYESVKHFWKYFIKLLESLGNAA